jgi:hypothetical protein
MFTIWGENLEQQKSWVRIAVHRNYFIGGQE